MSDSSSEGNFFDSDTFGDVEDLAMNESDEINLSDVGQAEDDANEVTDAQAIRWGDNGAPLEDSFDDVDTNMIDVTDDSDGGDMDLLNLNSPDASAGDDSEFTVAQSIDDSDDAAEPAVAAALTDDNSIDDMAAFNTPAAVEDSVDDLSGFPTSGDDEDSAEEAAGINQPEQLNAQSSDRVATIVEPVATKSRVHKEPKSGSARPSRSLGKMLKLPAIVAIIGVLGYGGFTILSGGPVDDLDKGKAVGDDDQKKNNDNQTGGGGTQTVDVDPKPNTNVVPTDPNSAAAVQEDLAAAVKLDTPDKAAQLAAISVRLNQLDLEIVKRGDLEAIKNQVDKLSSPTNKDDVTSTIETIQLKLDYFISILPDAACEVQSDIRDEFGSNVALRHPVVWLTAAIIGYDEIEDNDAIKEIAINSKLAFEKLTASKAAEPQQAKLFLDEAMAALVAAQLLNNKLPVGATKRLGNTKLEKSKSEVVAQLQIVTLKLIAARLKMANNSATAADTSKTKAMDAEGEAEASKTKAKAAEVAADTSKDNVALAEKAAGTSQANAATAEKAATTSQGNAKTAETAAIKSKDDAKTAETAAIASRKKADEVLVSLLRSSISQLLITVNDRIKKAKPQAGTAPSAELNQVEKDVKVVQEQDLTKRLQGDLLKDLVTLQDAEKQLGKIEKNALVAKAKTLDPNELKAAIELVLKGQIEKGVLSDVKQLKGVKIGDLVSRDQAKADAKEIAEELVKTIKIAGGTSPADLIKLKNALEASLKKALEGTQKKTAEQVVAAKRPGIIAAARKGLTGGLSKEAMTKINDSIKVATDKSTNAEKLATEAKTRSSNAEKTATAANGIAANAQEIAKAASVKSTSAENLAKAANSESMSAAKAASAADDKATEAVKIATSAAKQSANAEKLLLAATDKITAAEQHAEAAENTSKKALTLADATSKDLTKTKGEYEEKFKDVYAKIAEAHNAPRPLSPEQLKQLTGLVSSDVYKKLASWGYVPLQAPKGGPGVLQDPNLARSLFQDAYNEMFSKSGSLDAARRLFAKAVQHDMQNPVYRYFLGLSMYCGDDAVGGMEQVRIGARLEKAQDASRYVATRLERIQFKERKWLNRIRIEELSRRSP